MKQIYSNLKKGEVKVKVENLDDLWYLSQIIDLKDLVSGTTLRKIKIGKEDERNPKIVKKSVRLSLEVEKVEFHLYSNILRVSGIITEGPEDISLGSHHTFNVEVLTEITIIKPRWLKYQLDRLKEALESKSASILICIFDREDAYFALTKKYGYEILTNISGQVQKKFEGVIAKGSFYQEIITLLEEYATRHKVEHILLASPAFWKEDLVKQIKNPELKNKIVLATCSSVGENAINEVLRRPEVQQVLKKERTAKEVALVEELFNQISKDGLATYGLKETSHAVNTGAVRILLVTDSFIQDVRRKNIFPEIEALLKNVEDMKGEIHIISSEHEAGKKLNGLGGIASILRYKL